MSGDPAAARNPVSDEAAASFSRWKRHPAVARLAAMRASGFAGNVPAQYAVYLSSPPAVREAVAAPPFFAQLAGGADRLAAWRTELGDFARASGFESWEAGRAARREAELASVRAASGGRDLAGPLARYLGARTWSSWTVIVSPFFAHGGGAAWVIEERPGLPEVDVVYGPYRRGRRDSGAPDGPAEYAASVLPEAVFSMTYAMYEVCRPGLKPEAGTCRGLGGLSSPEDCLQQNWVRGVVARLLESEYGAGAADAYRRRWPENPYRDRVEAALRAYEADRSRLPDLMAAAGSLAAPFQEDGKAPACREDPARAGETVYARRVAYYREGAAAQRGGGSERR